MSVLTFDSVAATRDGFLAQGTLDSGATEIHALHVAYKLSEDNMGNISDVARGPGDIVRVTCSGHQLRTGDRITVLEVSGTTEANGDWRVNRISDDIFDLRDSSFQHAYTSGGRWFMSHSSEHLMEVDVLAANWSLEVIVPRDAFYSVSAKLFWAGTPSVIPTNAMDVNLYSRP